MSSKNQLPAGLIGALVVFAQALPVWANVDWNWNQVQTNTKDLDKAMAAYQGGDVETALTVLNNMKNGASQDVRASHVLIDIYREQKRYGEAKSAIQDLINSFTRYINTHNVSPPWMNPNLLKSELGDIAYEEGNYSEALASYRDAATGGPTLSQPRANIAKVLEQQGDLEGARHEIKTILDMSTVTANEKSFYLDKANLLDKAIAAKQAGGGQTAAQPGGQPGMQPGGQPGMQPGGQPGMQPGGQPGMQPGGQPGMQPGGQPGTQAGGIGSSSVSTGQFPSATVTPHRVGTGPLQVAADEISSRKYEAAITLLKAVIEKTPANAQAHYLLAVAYASSHQIASARDEYEATLKYAQDMKLQKLASSGLAKIQANK